MRTSDKALRTIRLTISRSSHDYPSRNLVQLKGGSTSHDFPSRDFELDSGHDLYSVLEWN